MQRDCNALLIQRKDEMAAIANKNWDVSFFIYI